jgi:hypothetical protein
MPPQAYVGAMASLRRRLHRRHRRLLRVVVDVAIVAAAAVLIVALLLPGHQPVSTQAVPTAVLFEDAYRGAGSVELDTICEQMDQVEARLVAALPPVPEEGLAKPAANDEAGKVFDDPWLEELLQNLSS